MAQSTYAGCFDSLPPFFGEPRFCSRSLDRPILDSMRQPKDGFSNAGLQVKSAARLVKGRNVGNVRSTNYSENHEKSKD
ncbi:hypothetical protein RvY_12235 [Ramazzottius varieornatus]|uniref:Uncharacterized protein n=1 Tax=Ramazzottius varieornatus TaxID=947166 RepID=A0A1D1VSK9_RAMVA|nr:hypothetical protein RvY_12235 [Ramazzottius varieornatus]